MGLDGEEEDRVGFSLLLLVDQGKEEEISCLPAYQKRTWRMTASFA
jgi:hypothetical protein